MLNLRSLKILVQNLTSLKDLRLSGVQISSPVPNILSNVSGLTTLHLIGCGLHVEFPLRIFKLPKLQDLRVSDNQDLMGYLPKFYSSSPLKTLSLGGTIFSGKLLASIGNLNSLNELLIEVIDFSGHISPSIGNLTQLTTLVLVANYFTGQIPSSFSNLISLKYVNIGYCQLSGSIPASFGNLSQLTLLILSENYIRIANLSSLSWLGKLSTLTCLGIGGINLTMEIPSSLANLTQLHYLEMSWNQLSGPIPSWFANLTLLTELYLSFNKLQGPFPISILKLEKLETLNLHLNNLSGIVTLDMFHKLKYLIKLLLSMNNISFHTKNETNATKTS